MMIPDNKITSAKAIDILALIPVNLRKVSTAGEFAGPCPWCGGDDRFRVWPETGRWWCRQCDRMGDQVDLVQQLHNLTFAQAVERLAGGSTIPKSTQQTQIEQPDFTAWQDRARRFTGWCMDQISDDCLEYLQSRLISREVVFGAGLGWNPKAIKDKGSKWGLTGEVYLPAGLVIPHEHMGQVTAINIRTDNGYRIVKGSRLAINGHRLIYKPCPWPIKKQVILFEGEIDALSAWDCLTDPTVGVGSIPAGNLTSLDQLDGRDCFVCFDTDQAGRDATDKAVQMGAKSINIPTDHKDFNEFLTAVGQDAAAEFLTKGIRENDR